VKDASGNDQTIGYSFATSQDIYVNVELSKNAAFPVNGEELVKSEIIKYIGGVDGDNQYAGLGMAANVVHAQIVGSILRNVAGIADLEVTLRKGTSGSFLAQNVTIGSTEVAGTDADKVTVNVS
jgi:hypothetical protein